MSSGGPGGLSPQDKNIRVIVRTRPSAEFAQGVFNIADDQQSINIHVQKSADSGFINNQQVDWSFAFDRVMHNASQEAIFEEFGAPLVRSVMDGYNATVLAYGQTGAGKTFTMTGANESYRHRGLIPRAISALFAEIAQRPDTAFTVHASYLEIYNEALTDLLGGSAGAAQRGRRGADGRAALTVVDDRQGSTVRGLRRALVNSEEEALHCLFEGETSRTLAEHQLNRSSSRSHCIFTLFVESRSRVDSSGRVLCARLNLVDLAGSERLSKARSAGTTLKEAMHINRSLTFLEQVVMALADRKREHVPYRQCKLTSVLRNALGGNCQTVLFANVRTEATHVDETISTLRFATRMMCVTNAPVVNVTVDPNALLRRYEQEISDLRQELVMRESLAGAGGRGAAAAYEPFAELHAADVQRQVLHYLEHDQEPIEITSVRQIREVLVQMRVLYRQLRHAASRAAPALGGTAAGAQLLDVLQRQAASAQGEWPQDASAADRTSGSGDGGFASAATAAAAAAGARALLDAPLGTFSTAQTLPQQAPQAHLEPHVEDGVGEAEDSGFGVGIASVGVRQPPKERAYVVTGLAGPAARKDAAASVLSKRHAAPSTPVAAVPNGASTLVAARSGSVGGTGKTSAADVAGAEATTPGSPAESTGHIGPGEDVLTAAAGPEGNATPNSNPTPGHPPNRSAEFEAFKRGRGAELNRLFQTAKLQLRDRRADARALADEMNRIKERCDAIRASVDRPQRGPSTGGRADARAPAVARVMDEDEYGLLNELQQLRAQYRELHDQLAQQRAEIEYLQRQVDAGRQRLLGEFEAYYDATFGVVPSHGAAAPDAQIGVDDVLDFGEKFERLQMERICQEDHNSLAYFQARKAMDGGRGGPRRPGVLRA